MTTKLLKVSAQRTDKQGQPYVSQYSNKEQAKVSIQIDDPQFAGVWLSNFVELGDPVEQWKVGQTVDIVTTKKGNFWNFKVARGVTPNAPSAGTGVWTPDLVEKVFVALRAIFAQGKQTIELLEAMKKQLNQLEIAPDEDEIAANVPPIKKEEDIPF